MDLSTFVNQYWYVLVIFGIIIIGSFVFSVINKNHMKTSNNNFLAEHPDAAKVWLSSRVGVTSETMQVFSVNGGKPQAFTKGTKTGVYLLPGQNTVVVNYTYNRPGVMYRNVSKSTGAVTKELVVEANKTYLLSFDRKAESFTFEETTPEE